MAKHRQGDPWIPNYDYGAMLPALSLNLLVSDMVRSLDFYREVLAAVIHYHDPDFAAVRVGPAELMLHADHTHENHPWHAALLGGAERGLGAEIRLLGIDPDLVEQRAAAWTGALVSSAVTTGHAWREVIVRDPDGYHWAVGVLVDRLA